MEFDHKQLFIYDRGAVKGKHSFKEVADAYDNHQSDFPNSFPLTGLTDLMETNTIIEEYYSNFPLVAYKEMARGIGVKSVQVDPLYNEPAALRREFSRVIDIPTHVAQEDKDTNLTKQGAQTTNLVEFTTGLVVLYRRNYFPEIGDELVWLGTPYQIGEVIFKKDHYHHNTGFPLHVTMKASIVQWGDEQFTNSLLDKGRNLSPPQGGNVPPMGHNVPVIRVSHKK